MNKQSSNVSQSFCPMQHQQPYGMGQAMRPPTIPSYNTSTPSGLIQATTPQTPIPGSNPIGGGYVPGGQNYTMPVTTATPASASG